MKIQIMEAVAPHFPRAAVAVMVLGFILATTLGSIAWYNSTRPLGWKNKTRPDIIPEIDS